MIVCVFWCWWCDEQRARKAGKGKAPPACPGCGQRLTYVRTEEDRWGVFAEKIRKAVDEG